MKPRIAIPLCVLAVTIVYGVFNAIPEDRKAQFDPWLLIFIGLVYTLCMLSTLVYTRRWTIRSAGILLTLAGDGVLYTGSGAASKGWIDRSFSPHIADLARSCFVVGGPLLLLGLWLWWRDRQRCKQADLADALGLEGLP